MAHSQSESTLEEGALVSLSGVETSSPLRDDFHVILIEISLLIS